MGGRYTVGAFILLGSNDNAMGRALSLACKLAMQVASSLCGDWCDKLVIWRIIGDWGCIGRLLCLLTFIAVQDTFFHLTGRK